MGQSRSFAPHPDDGGEKLADYVVAAAAALSDEEVLELADSLHELLRARRRQRRSIRSYAVLQAGAEWQIVCSRRRMGHFSTRELALQAGARLAAQARRDGHQVELLLQGPTGELHRTDPETIRHESAASAPIA